MIPLELVAPLYARDGELPCGRTTIEKAGRAGVIAGLQVGPGMHIHWERWKTANSICSIFR